MYLHITAAQNTHSAFN